MTTARVASARQVFLENHLIPLDERTAIENSFFKSLSMPNGSHKTTAPNRLTDVDQVTYDLLKDKKTVCLQDIGISSGVTTIELVNHLESRGIEVSGIGVDVCVKAYLKSFFGIDILLNEQGYILQVAAPGFARGRPHPSQKALRSKLLTIGMDLLQSSLVRRCLLNSGSLLPLDLVSPRLVGHRDFRVVEHDISIPMLEWNECFDLVRAANVLNLDYFPVSQIVGMVTNLVAWLKEDGILAICRTEATSGTNHGSFYRKKTSPVRLQQIYRMGEGYELERTINESFSAGLQAVEQ